MYYNSIENGIRLFYDIVQKKSISQMKINERKNLIACYSVIDKGFMDNISSLPVKLTIQEQLFCIFKKMRMNDAAIMDVLCVSVGALKKRKVEQ